ncbi:unnamed protein product [Microthlaspi erraticum]|uniref:Uncharacterized protein n=1 Tax=Microthlaspi erraticum TaxID=1685480 RepID=A0A6D2KBZ5_9BRAS|nr:unnamed protein product [Microthlaspi erraticum]
MPDSVPLEALRNGLWYDSKFKEDLSLKPPATLEDAFHRSGTTSSSRKTKRFYAEKHGDRRATSSKPREEPGGTKKTRSEEVSPRSVRSSRRRVRARARSAFRCHKTSTPLGDDNDTKAFCKFHGRTGHATENCKHL